MACDVQRSDLSLVPEDAHFPSFNINITVPFKHTGQTRFTPRNDTYKYNIFAFFYAHFCVYTPLVYLNIKDSLQDLTYTCADH